MKSEVGRTVRWLVLVFFFLFYLMICVGISLQFGSGVRAALMMTIAEKQTHKKGVRQQKYHNERSQPLPTSPRVFVIPVRLALVLIQQFFFFCVILLYPNPARSLARPTAQSTHTYAHTNRSRQITGCPFGPNSPSRKQKWDTNKKNVTRKKLVYET